MIAALSVYAGKYEKVAPDTYSWSFALGWLGAAMDLISAAMYGAGVFFVLKNVHTCTRGYQSLK